MNEGSAQQSNHDAGGPMTGILHSIKQLLATLLSMAQTRMELFAIELQEDIYRLGVTLLWSLVALFALGMGCLLAALTLIFIFWDTHRVLVSISVTAVFFGGGLLAVLIVAKRLRDYPRMLQGITAELQCDQELLRARQ